VNKDVQRFMDAVPEDQKPHFNQLHALIMSMYPDAEIVISYQVPTYKVKSRWVALGYWKGGVSIYTNSPEHIAAFKAQHPAVKTGKASINFKLTEPLPVEAVKKVIQHAIEGSG